MGFFFVATFAHNHALNRSSGFSPFQVVYGLLPRGPLDLTTLPDHTRLHGVAADFVDNIHQVHVQVITNLQSSSSKYKAASDSHRRRVLFEVGDQVWAFLTKDRMPAHAYNKLKAKKIGPLTVLERINDNVYRLQLPAHITTSDVFNVLLVIHFLLLIRQVDQTKILFYYLVENMFLRFAKKIQFYCIREKL
ncbi:hypothetical protein Bca52824_074216 [Brassica carinata]|uniref:Tf2-1-like SH3-like domain-containing protein n=1 Tax=Brassica carinata TaxID=52824 RepID=A0A8X7U601_BRACI|nr:hypothetical protein Bca52824_074216 [Brassica carinata]